MKGTIGTGPVKDPAGAFLSSVADSGVSPRDVK